MLALGYGQYVTQGGDWGFLITRFVSCPSFKKLPKITISSRALGHLYPSHVKALHTNWALAPFPSFTSSPLLAITSLFKHALGSYLYTPRERADLARAKLYVNGDTSGYFALLSTKPTTVSFSLSDSPVGLLAFVYEKLHDWTDKYPWTDDEILTWISIYWFSEAGPGASGYIYKEFKRDKVWKLSKLQSWVSQPLGFRYFPGEIVSLPKGWLHAMGKVVQVRESDKGGHFGAWECPEVIVDDLREMFGKGGGAFGVVEGKSGY